MLCLSRYSDRVPCHWQRVTFAVEDDELLQLLCSTRDVDAFKTAEGLTLALEAEAEVTSAEFSNRARLLLLLVPRATASSSVKW